MVGGALQIFRLNLHFDSELFIRFSAIVAGTLNTWIIYCIGRQLRDELTGWYTALLYTASIYGFVIIGIFILPDAPQSVFWLTAILYLLKAFSQEHNPNANRSFLIASVFIGLGLLSKYTTAFLWFGIIMYILFHDRRWLRTRSFWIGHLIMAILFLPVLIWNAQHGFVSFLYHSARVEPLTTAINPDNFLTELLGETLYTNPVNLVLIILAVISFFSTKSNLRIPETKLLIWISLPLISIFLLASIFRSTLPHWNGAGFLTLIPLAALRLRNHTSVFFPKLLKTSLVFIILLITLAITQTFTGIIPFDSLLKNKGGLGQFDYSLEVFGWSQLHDGFAPLAAKYEQQGLIASDAPIVTYRWFPAANYEYYITRGTSRHVIAAGDTSEIHKYVWINQLHGGLKLNGDAWYITSSRDFRMPSTMTAVYYQKVSPPDTIPIRRMGRITYCFYVYRLTNLQTKHGF